MDFRITLSAFFNLNMPIFIARIDFMAHAIRFKINSEIIFNWYIAYEYFSKRTYTHLENKLYDVVEWNIFSNHVINYSLKWYNLNFNWVMWKYAISVTIRNILPMGLAPKINCPHLYSNINCCSLSSSFISSILVG